MQIIRGKIAKAQKIVVYGPEGIGKSTFASHFPNPLFIDTEGSTVHLDVGRYEKPSSWTMLNEQVSDVLFNRPCKTLVIDTIDWAERLAIDYICANSSKSSITKFGYGEGFIQLEEEFGKFLNRLSDVTEKGINVVLTAHAKISKFEQPDELGAYDRYELKLGNKTTAKTAALVKEWSDMVLFANYKTFAVAVDKEGKKHKAQGGQRVMYTAHHPCWDAKNRHDLPNELPFEFKAIAHCLNSTTSTPSKGVETLPKQQPITPPTQAPIEQKTLNMTDNVGSGPMDYGVNENLQEDLYQGLPKALVDLMKPNNVTPKELQAVVAMKGYYPIDTAITNYEPSFIEGVLIGAWKQVFAMIEQERSIPF